MFDDLLYAIYALGTIDVRRTRDNSHDEGCMCQLQDARLKAKALPKEFQQMELTFATFTTSFSLEV